MTSLFNWSKTFLTGLSAVDQQHQHLVELINDLGEVAISGRDFDQKSFEAMRDELLNYARAHFAEEIALMKQAGVDPRHVKHHSAEHRIFAMDAIALSETSDAPFPDRVRRLVDYLVNWLAYHILGVDQSMARQIRAIEGGLSPSQAFEQDAQYVQAGTEPLLAALSGLFQVVSERNRALRALNRELDERVQQRTIELEQANRQLQMLAVHDELTGLHNRRFAISALDELWAEAQRDGTPLSVLMLDADHFKPVNDRFGHATGDALLRALASRLQNAVRTSDFVCRLGGDEFLVICPRSPLDGAALVAEKILAECAPFYTEDGIECWDGSISIGLAEADESMVRPEDLLHAADEALYVAKRGGGAQLSGSVHEASRNSDGTGQPG